MKQILVVAIALIASFNSFAQTENSSNYWEAYYNRKNDPETWKKVSTMSEKELQKVSKPKSEPTLSSKVANTSKNFELSMGLNYGFNNTIGFEIFGGQKAIFGIGMDYFIGKGAIGEEYTNFHWTTFASDTYEHVTKPNASIYGIIGYKVIENLSVQGNVGVSTNLTYHNAFDKSRILGNGGYYYTSSDAGTNLLYGGSLQYQLDKVGLMVGYNNFSGAKFGFNYSF
jgi:hypothetical protein